MLLLLASAAYAASLSLGLDARSFSVGETVPLTLQLTDGSVRGAPDVPVDQGLDLSFQGQSQQTIMVNFQTTRIVQFNYALTATAPGTWTIGPVNLVVDGQTLTARAVSVTVTPRSETARAARDVSASLTDTRPYLGQVVVYRFRFEHKGEVLDARWTQPSFDGFVKEPTAEPAQFETPIVRDGDSITVQEIDVPLVATGPGARTISPAMLTVQVPVERKGRRGQEPRTGFPFSRFDDVTNETLTTPPMPVTVRTLPSTGKPADFSGLVGHYTLTAKPSATELKLGESLTLEVVLSGDGSLSGFHLPPPAEGAGYRVYDDQPELSAKVEAGTFVGTATFRRAVVPEAEGTLEIPPMGLSVFDPQQGAYVTLKTDPITVHVSPGEAGAGQVTSFAGAADQRRDVAALGEDILPSPGDVRVFDQTLDGALVVAIVPPVLPVLGLVGLLIAGRTRTRRRDPWAELRAGLDSLPADPVARLGALEALFRETAGLRLGLPAAGLERAQVEPLGDEASALYADLERARYGGIPVGDLEPRVRRFIEAAS